MKRRILSVFMLTSALFASQNIFAGNTMYQQANNDDTVIESRLAGRGPDKDFKFDVEEMTYDVASGEEFVLPTLLNPHKLTIDSYPTPDNQEQAITIIRDEKTHEVKSIKVNKSFIGDFHIYATAKKSSKYGESSAKCLVHFINSAIVERIDFTSTDFETQQGNTNGWSQSSQYDVWRCQCTEGWYINTYGQYFSGYAQCYLVSPEMQLAEGVNKVELIQSLTGFDNPERDAQFLIKEAGAAEWTVIEGMVYEHEGGSYDFYSTGHLNIPAELQGKNVQFAFMFGTDSDKPYRWAIKEVRLLKVEEDTPTAIQGVEVKDNADNTVYDLMGRRVFNPTKGIYVVNGKKVIIK